MKVTDSRAPDPRTGWATVREGSLNQSVGGGVGRIGGVARGDGGASYPPTVGAKPSNRNDFDFSRKRESIVITSENLRVRLAGRALGEGPAALLRDFQVGCDLCTRNLFRDHSKYSSSLFSAETRTRKKSFCM